MPRSIYTKLLLLVALPLALFIVSVVVLQTQIKRVNEQFIEHVETNERILSNINHILIAFNHARFTITPYLLSRDTKYIREMNTKLQALEGDINQLRDILSGQQSITEYLRSLKRQIIDYRNNTLEVIRTTEQLDKNHQAMNRQLGAMDRFLDEELEPLARSGDSGQIQKLEVLTELETITSDIARRIEEFLADRNSGYQTQVEDDIDDLKGWYESYTALSLNARERELALQLQVNIDAFVAIIRETMATNTLLTNGINNLLVQGQDIDIFLEEKLSRPFREQHESKLQNMVVYTDEMVRRSIFILALGILAMIIILLYSLLEIIRPLRLLTEAVEDGSLERLEESRIPDNELRLLGNAFRRMSAKLNTIINELREREEFLAITLNSMGDGVIITDIDGRITKLNPIAEGLTGWTTAEARGSPAEEVFRIIHGDTRLQCPSPFREVLDSGRSLELGNNTLLISRDGREFTIADSAAPIRGEDGRIRGCVLIFRDTMEKVRQKQVLDNVLKASQVLAKAKGDFLANMSHEIRTPMNAITGMAHLLEDTQLDKNQKIYVQNMLYGCETLLNIINDILDYSKIEAGKLSMERLPFRLDRELEALAKLLCTSAEDKGLELEIKLASDVPHTVVSDRIRLRQILTNLINNAIKFTPRGKVSLQVSRLLLQEDKNRMKLQFEVSDTGIGMGEQTLSGLFQPFAQGDPSISRRHGGTGLGLAISKQLVRMMGGDISVRSAPGAGSTFYFTIWCGTVDQVQRLSKSSDEVTQRPGDRVQGLHVLVVDDVDMNRTVARAILTRRGAQVTEAGDGNQALKLLYETPEKFDAVLMDVHMPGVDGLTATHALRGDPRFARLPVIALTASAMEQDQKACREAGMTDFLSKPIVPDHLYRMLEKYTGVA